MDTEEISLMVHYFVDGSDVDYKKMHELGLVSRNGNEYTLTDHGKTFIFKNQYA